MTDRLGIGIEIEEAVLQRGGTREDIALVVDERPDVVAGFADSIIETAKTIRADSNCFRLVDDEVVIQLPALNRPTLQELQKKYSWIERVERDDSTEEAVTLRMATVLKSDEPSINSPVYERRLVPLRGQTLGFQHLDWFVKNQDEIPEPVRSALRELLGRVYIDFPGIIVVGVSGRRFVPSADQYGKRFGEYWFDLDDDFLRDGRIAVSSK